MIFLKELATLLLLAECTYAATLKGRSELFEVRLRFVPYSYCDSDNNLFKNNRIGARSSIWGDLDINQDIPKRQRCGAAGRGAPRDKGQCPAGQHCVPFQGNRSSPYMNGECVPNVGSVGENGTPR